MGELLAEIGDLVFSLVIGYIGAIELLYVARHLYHWSFSHQADSDNDADSLQRLQESMRTELSEAERREAQAGAKAMQDGVLYKDGFRLDPQGQESNASKDHSQEAKEKRRKEIEAELAKQKKIEEETRRQLEKAEAELARQRIQAEEEEAKENARKLLEAERNREEEQRKLEEQQEVERKREEQRKKEAAEREAAENERKLIEAERQRAEEQRQKEMEAQEAAENERKLIEAETRREEEQRRREREAEEEREAAEMTRRLLEAERERELREQQHDLDEEEHEQSRMLTEAERERERKQKLIEENARRFLEAEKEMVELQQQMEEAATQRLVFQANAATMPSTPVIEEPCIKKIITPLTAEGVNERLSQTVKTQFGQTSNEPYSLTSKTLIFPSLSDDGTSIEPNSSKQSSFSTQPSEEVATGTDDATTTITQLERQEPDGEDNVPTIQYTDEYLRSLDGIKHRPLVREDGSGRRRAFKKRRSSGSSTSSRDSRTSREEEIKMFTSLEEEELQDSQKGDGDYAPIRYTSEPTLKVKTHHRRHKRSPAKDMHPADDSLRNSLEMLGEENSNPWGELAPEHYKDTEFWKREKAISIDEEVIDLEKSVEVDNDTSTNIPKTSSFEEATDTQNKAAVSVLQKQGSKETMDEEHKAEAAADDNTQRDTKTNFQTSQNTETNAPPTRSRSRSPCLRRSPRIEEIDQYEESRMENAEVSKTFATPTIAVEPAVDNGPWRDEHGLIMEGLSDFYDFTASIHPSRSRSTSRNPSPASSLPHSPAPRDVSYEHGGSLNENRDSPSTSSNFIDVYDDTDMLMKHK